MREAAERQFRQLLEQHDREFLTSTTSKADRVLREQAFDRRFHECCNTVVEPVMTKLQALMRDHGLQSAVITTRHAIAPDGKVTPSAIAFEFRVLTDPETQGFPVTTPTLSYIADPANHTVLVHENTILPFLGGHVGLIGQCTLDDLTGERVEQDLLAVAGKVLRGTDVT